MGNPSEKLKKILIILGITGAVYGSFRFLLPLIIPFLLAYGTALWLRPSIRCIQRRVYWTWRGKKKVPPAVLVGGTEIVIFTVILTALGYFGGTRLMEQLKGVASEVPVWIENAFGVQKLLQKLGELIRSFSVSAIMNNSISFLSRFAKGIVVVAVYIVAVFLFLGEMEEIRARKSKSMFHREFAMIGKRIVEIGSAWLKTELILLLFTSGLCTTGFLLIGNHYAWILGIGVGLLDALPLFGSGVVLVPWGIWMFVQKRWFSGGLLIGIYVVCYFLRQILEARIMGDQVGLTPVETLIAMYVGLQLFGLSGFILGPIGLLLIEDFVDFVNSEY